MDVPKEDVLTIDSEDYEMHQIFTQAVLDPNPEVALWTFWVMNDQTLYTNGSMTGSGVNMIAFSIIFNGTDDETIPTGVFEFGDTENFSSGSVYLNFTWGQVLSGTQYRPITEGILEISKSESSDFLVSFIGVIGGKDVSCNFTGELTQISTLHLPN